MTKRFIFFIAGFQDDTGRELVTKQLLRKGNKLTLIREPKNPHDPYAISIWKKDKKLGYVPRIINRKITGAKAGCMVLKVDSKQVPWQMCKVVIDMEGTEDRLVELRGVHHFDFTQADPDFLEIIGG